jgi:hypothetical protein
LGQNLKSLPLEKVRVGHQHDDECRLKQMHPADEDLVRVRLNYLSRRMTDRPPAQHLKRRTHILHRLFDPEWRTLVF